ncbi:MAG: AP2 domain-containing protein [Oscillospiraceae bacterium]|nr:AP2 domain-containing protein [Oscillospiraceae bacterium]
MKDGDGRSKRLIDLVGKRFGNLVVLKRYGSDKWGKPTWLCKCDCGNETIVGGSHLKRGDTKSCGCMQGVRGNALKPDNMKKTHKNKLYNQWSGMIYRCYNDGATDYKYYGGRGICVCKDWKEDFENFANWALTHGYSKDKEIDRIDNEKMYCPKNCRWISHKSNSRNRRARNRSGISGVNFRASRTGVGGSWRVGIMADGKQINIGTYSDFEKAVEMRKQAEIKYWGFTKIK